MKKKLFSLLSAVLLTFCFLFPAVAAEPPASGFRPIQIEGSVIRQKYALEDTSAELFCLAAYDSTGRLAGFVSAAPAADGQEHELVLTADREVARVRLFQTTRALVPTAEAVTLYFAPSLLSTVISTEQITVMDLYLDEVDEEFEGYMADAVVLPGDVVDYYANEDGSITAEVTHYTLVQVTSVGKSVSLNDGQYTISKEKFAGFDYAKGDYLLVVLNDAEDEVLASEKAAIVSGQIIAMKGKNKFKIGDTYYENLSDTEITLKHEITAVLNKANQIVLVLENTASVPPTTDDSDPPAPDTSDVLYAVLVDSSYIYYVEDDGTVTYTYIVLIEDDERELTFLAPLELAEGDAFGYTVNKYGYAVFAGEASA